MIGGGCVGVLIHWLSQAPQHRPGSEDFECGTTWRTLLESDDGFRFFDHFQHDSVVSIRRRNTLTSFLRNSSS